MKENHEIVGCDDTVNDVILRYPVTLGIFKMLGIDSCCGGGLTVHEAAKRHGHDPATVKHALTEAASQQTAA